MIRNLKGKAEFLRNFHKKRFFEASYSLIRGCLENIDSGDFVWLDFPVSKASFNNALNRLDIASKKSNNYLFVDWESPIQGLDVATEFGETRNVEKVNKIASALASLDDDEVKMAVTIVSQKGCSLECAVANVRAGNVYGYEDVDDYTTLAETLIDEQGGVESLDKETLERYFDFAAYGRAIKTGDTNWVIDEGAVYTGDLDENLTLD